MISLCVAARNEAQRIGRLLRSVRDVVSEVCLVDDGSLDGTSLIVKDWCEAQSIPCRACYISNGGKGYPDYLYNRLLAMSAQPWTLLLDADEELTEEGRSKILGMIDAGVDVWQIPRLTIINNETEPIYVWEAHPRLFCTGTLRYPEGDQGPHQVAYSVDGAIEREFRSERPFFTQTRSGREQLRRDKLRNQYPSTPLPPYYQSVPGWCDYEAILDLMVEEARPGGHIVEVGCWLGKSTCYLGQKAKEADKGLTVWAVDHFRGSDEAPHREFFAQGRNLYAECMRNLDGAGLLDTVRVLPVTSTQASVMIEEIDSVFLDASHDFENVLHDIQSWSECIRDGGIIAGHDYSSAWPGVVQAVDACFFQSKIDKATSPGSWLVRL